MTEQVAYGNTTIAFSIRRTGRKTLAIEVHPDLSVRVVAPAASSLAAIREKVLKRARWIVRQQAYFEQFLPRTPERQYVPGETHFYLGRKYVLRVRPANKEEVKLKGGQLVVFLNDVNDTMGIKRLLGSWYYAHAKRRFQQTIEDCLSRFKKHQLATGPPLTVKRMERRWGSCTPNGRIILNPEIIKTPAKCIEYVVIHELCHLIHPNHSREFYELQTEIMPDWEKWKLKLEKTLI